MLLCAGRTLAVGVPSAIEKSDPQQVKKVSSPACRSKADGLRVGGELKLFIKAPVRAAIVGNRAGHRMVGGEGSRQRHLETGTGTAAAQAQQEDIVAVESVQRSDREGQGDGGAVRDDRAGGRNVEHEILPLADDQRSQIGLRRGHLLGAGAGSVHFMRADHALLLERHAQRQPDRISDEFPRSMAQLPLVTLAPCVPRMPVAEPDRLRLPVLSHSKLHPSICTCPEAMSLALFLLADVTENVEYTPPTTLAGTASASGLA